MSEFVEAAVANLAASKIPSHLASASVMGGRQAEPDEKEDDDFYTSFVATSRQY